MDSFDHSAAAETPDMRLHPAGHGPAGEAASAEELAHAERRAARLASLERVRLMTEQAAGRLVEYMGGQLTEDEALPFERITDPSLALNRLTRALRQIVALEEKIDEDEEVRRKRLAAEAAARREKEERQRRAPAEALRERKRKAIRHAVRNARRDGDPDLDHGERERLLDDLFSDYETYDEDYSADPAAIVLELCREAGLAALESEPAGEDAASDDAADPFVRAEAAALAIARRYLMEVAPDLCPPEDDDEPPAQAQGPP